MKRRREHRFCILWVIKPSKSQTILKFNQNIIPKINLNLISLSPLPGPPCKASQAQQPPCSPPQSPEQHDHLPHHCGHQQHQHFHQHIWSTRILLPLWSPTAPKYLISEVSSTSTVITKGINTFTNISIVLPLQCSCWQQCHCHCLASRLTE